MNKLDKLIKEFCPNGVGYYKLSQLFKTQNGYTTSKNNSEYWANGTVPWFRMEDIRENGNKGNIVTIEKAVSLRRNLRSKIAFIRSIWI